jgi:hypothetical protein
VTLAWLVSLLERPRLRTVARGTGTVLAVASVVELAAVVLQVVRGRQSHFNETTPFDAGVYAAMGFTVVVIFTCTVVVAVAVVMTPLVDRAVTWAVRLGLGISLAGLAVGFLMVVPRAAQLQAGSRIVGAHGVGTADGGSGLPFVGWSTTGGDLRIAHFVGMHALQALPLSALALGVLPVTAGLTARTRVHVVLLAAAGYAGVVALVLWQALRGQSLVHPDAATVVAVAALLAALGVGVAVVVLAAGRTTRPGSVPAPARAGSADAPPNSHRGSTLDLVAAGSAAPARPTGRTPR